MPARLPDELLHSVIMFCMKGDTLDEIAAKTGVSYGEVRVIIDRWKQGKYPAYAGFQPYNEALRWLSKHLKTSGLSLQQCVVGAAVFEALTSLGIDPAQFRQMLAVVNRISPPGFPIQQFTRAAIRMIELESSTGMDYLKLEARATGLQTEIPQLEDRKKKLSDTINGLQELQEKESQNFDRTLANHSVTTERLEEYVNDKEVLKKAGLELADIKPIAELVKKGTQENLLGTIREMAKLESQTGMDHTALLASYKEKFDQVVKLGKEKTELQEKNTASSIQLQQVQKDIQKKLQDNQTTERELEQYITVRERLSSRGIKVETIGVIETMATEFEKYGYQADEIVTHLQQIGDLEKRKAEAITEYNSARKELDQTQKGLQVVKGQVANENARLDGVKAEISQCQNNLVVVQQKVKEEEDRVRLGEGFLSLATDPPRIKDEQLILLIERMQGVLSARKTVQRLPIDYEGLRTEFLSTFEKLTGKKLMSTDV